MSVTEKTERCGRAIRELRDRASLSQEELADKAGLSRNTVVTVEKGRVVPHPKTRRKLAWALGAEVEELWR